VNATINYFAWKLASTEIKNNFREVVKLDSEIGTGLFSAFSRCRTQQILISYLT